MYDAENVEFKFSRLRRHLNRELFITFLVGLFLSAVGRTRMFLFGRFDACINIYLHAKFEHNFSRACIKI